MNAREQVQIVLNVDRIREELNELPFRDGKREVFVGRVSEDFEGDSEQTVADHVRHCEQELRGHTLVLTRHADDRDALFVVQELRALPLDLSWMAKATNWIARIAIVVLAMVLPGLAGLWLDNQVETRFLGVLGFALGVPLGMWFVIVMTKRNGTRWRDQDER